MWFMVTVLAASATYYVIFLPDLAHAAVAGYLAAMLYGFAADPLPVIELAANGAAAQGPA